MAFYAIFNVNKELLEMEILGASMAIQLLQKIKVHKTILLRLIGVILLAWACYIPEVKLDLEHTYVKSGVLSEVNSRRGTTKMFNDKAICTGVYMLGCRTELKNSKELREVLKNKTPVEVVFARDVGNALGAVFFNRTFAIEVRLNGTPLPNCSQDEMLSNLYHPHWLNYLFSIFTFLITLPLIFNFRFYHNLLSPRKAQ